MRLTQLLQAIGRRLDLQATARRNAWAELVELGALRRQREDAERALAAAAIPHDQRELPLPG